MSRRLSGLVSRVWRVILATSTHHTTRKCLVPVKQKGVNGFIITYRVEQCPKRQFNVQNLINKLWQKFFASYTVASPTSVSRGRIMDPSQEENASLVAPLEIVRGMRTLDRTLFTRTVSVPCLKVPTANIGVLSKSMKVALFKMQRVKPVAELAFDDPCHKTHKLFLLNPKQFKSPDDFLEEDVKTFSKFGVDVKDLSFFELELRYENWPAAEILRAILPAHTEGISSYSLIGHIAHLNLKPEVMEYKKLIGQVILDKTSSVRTVVNKLNTIDNTFRNFHMELLAGEDNFVTRARENGCTFEMDFSKVYWNPRLSTEHMRVVDQLKQDDVLFDVFAGVGPFAIPSAKKGVRVHANDLNPSSYSALLRNVQINKVRVGMLDAYNLDGREFIRTAVKKELSAMLVLARAAESSCEDKNLAAAAEEPSGRGTGHDGDLASDQQSSNKSESAENVLLEKGKTKRDATLYSNSITKAKVCEQPLQRSLFPPRVFITMNLPALALDFLDAFCGLLSDLPENLRTDYTSALVHSPPNVLCYCFSKSDDSEADVRQRAEGVLGLALPSGSAVRQVRNVAPNKEMMVLMFPLTAELLFGGQDQAKVSDISQVNRPLDQVVFAVQDTRTQESSPAKRQRVA